MAPRPNSRKDDTMPAPEVKKLKAIVAHRRTVLAPTSEQIITGYRDNGDPVHRFVDKAFGPGEEVELPETEVTHLRRMGFLVDPDVKAVVYDDTGPRTLTGNAA